METKVLAHIPEGPHHIDGIFMTKDLYIVQGGYMPFGMGIGRDHRCLWLDIRTRVLMGQELEQLQHDGSNTMTQKLGINTFSTRNNI
jgi:hypothetical protein